MVDKIGEKEFLEIVMREIAKVSPISDVVVGQYIITMIRNGKTQAQLGQNLKDFFGNKSDELAQNVLASLNQKQKGTEKTISEKSEKKSFSSNKDPAEMDDDLFNDLDVEKYLEEAREEEKSAQKESKGGNAPSNKTKSEMSSQRTQRDLKSREKNGDLEPRAVRVRSAVEVPQNNPKERKKDLPAINPRMLLSAVQRATDERKHEGLPRPNVNPVVHSADTETERIKSQVVYPGREEFEFGNREPTKNNKRNSEREVKFSESLKRKARHHEQEEKVSAQDDVKVTIKVNLNDPDLAGLVNNEENNKKRKREPLPDSPIIVKRNAEEVKSLGLAPGKGNKQIKTSQIAERCSYWPNCMRGSACIYAHPTEPCKKFPNCPFGDTCLYIHPNVPASKAAAESQIACKFGFSCRNKNKKHGAKCPYSHPKVVCHFGKECQKGKLCKFSHAPICRNGISCLRPGCSFAHAETEEQVNQSVESISLSLPKTPPRDESSKTGVSQAVTNDQSASSQIVSETPAAPAEDDGK